MVLPIDLAVDLSADFFCFKIDAIPILNHDHHNPNPILISAMQRLQAHCVVSALLVANSPHAGD